MCVLDDAQLTGLLGDEQPPVRGEVHRRRREDAGGEDAVRETGRDAGPENAGFQCFKSDAGTISDQATPPGSPKGRAVTFNRSVAAEPGLLNVKKLQCRVAQCNDLEPRGG